MPRIQPYETSVGMVGPQDQRRAHATDFFVGPTEQTAGAIAGVSDMLAQRADQDDVSSARRSLAEARAIWTIKLNERAKHSESQLYEGSGGDEVSVSPGVGGDLSARVPGNDPMMVAGGETHTGALSVGGTTSTGGVPAKPPRLAYQDFSKQFVEDFSDDMNKRRGDLQTRTGQMFFDAHASNMTGDFTEKAFAAQSDLAGRKAVSDYQQALRFNTSTLMSDPTQFDSILKESIEHIAHDKNLPAGARDTLVNKTKADLAEATVRGWIALDPQYALEEKLGVGRTLHSTKANTPVEPPPGGWGKREDGTEKGNGYFGTLPRKDGSGKVSGELGIGMDLGDGKETEIPAMVPTLNKKELDFLLTSGSDALFDKKDPTARGIIDKAVAHAKARIADGKSVWAAPGERTPIPGGADDVQQNPVSRNGPYDEYLSSDAKHQLIGEARTEIRANLAEEERAKRAAKEARKAEQAKTQDQFLDKLAEGTLSWKNDVHPSNLDPFGEGSKDTFLREIERGNREGKTFTTNPATYRELQRRILLPFGSRDKIANEEDLFGYYKDLTPSDFKALRDEVRAGRDTGGDGQRLSEERGEFLKRADSFFRKEQLGVPDILADQNMYRFSQALDNAIANKRKAKEDPSSLFDPESKDYFMTKAPHFKRNQLETLLDMSTDAKRQERDTELAKTRKPGDPNPWAAEREKDVMPAPRDPASRKDGKLYENGRGQVMEWDATTQLWYQPGARPLPNPRSAR